MCDISVIVPIYHGKQYITGLVRQMEENCKKILRDYTVELILVNDDPDSHLEKNYSSPLIEVVNMDTDCNRGIHGTRVRGLGKSRGEYVVFLDQDDEIAPDYLDTQLKCIGDNSAVVCQLIHEGKVYYNTEYPFTSMMNKNYMLTEGCPIISPGQVLIRKNDIPDVWKEDIIRNNGADDFLLWLCMVREGKKFSLNDKVVFEHKVHYGNESWNSYQMLKSEEEMAEILKRNHVFPDAETCMLKGMLEHIRKRRLGNLDKFRRMFYILKDWVMLGEGMGIAGYLKSRGIREIAIYGIGYLGKILIKDLKNSEIVVRYVIDQDAQYIDVGYPAFTMEDRLQEVDAVIVTLVQGEENVVDMLGQKLGAAVFTLKGLVRELSGDGQFLADVTRGGSGKGRQEGSTW